MIGQRIMLIAGEPSGDLLAAELVCAFRSLPAVQNMPAQPQFFGAGGAQMEAAGVEIIVEMSQYSVFGLSDVLKQYQKFKKIFQRLAKLAFHRQPEVIILVDYSGFNLRFARVIKNFIRARGGTFNNWDPKIVYYVSPQVWASREYRVQAMREDLDLVLSIFPFEKSWYARRAPDLRVEFVGHPIVDRYSSPCRPPLENELEFSGKESDTPIPRADSMPLVVLLPGSRKRELEAHLPIMLDALKRIRSEQPIRMRMVLPSPALVKFALNCIDPLPDLEIQAKELEQSLTEASVAIACSGTVTLECAYFKVPSIVIYKTSWLTYQIARQIIKVKHIAMPNLIADELIYPELIQNEATPERIAQLTLDILSASSIGESVVTKLNQVVASLGPPGASRRAAEAIVKLLGRSA